jgi:signal transduction histidine kinase
MDDPPRVKRDLETARLGANGGPLQLERPGTEPVPGENRCVHALTGSQRPLKSGKRTMRMTEENEDTLYRPSPIASNPDSPGVAPRLETGGQDKDSNQAADHDGSDAAWRHLVTLWPGVLFRQRPDFSFAFVSDQILGLTGVTPAEWDANPARFWEVVHESDVVDVRRQCEQLARHGGESTTTYRLRHWTSGRIHHIQERRRTLTSAEGNWLGFEGVWLDVTRQTLAERRLTATAWKETLALVTMGLAHDLANVIAGVHSLSESFLVRTEESHPFHEGLSLIRKNSLYAGQVLHRIVNLHQNVVGERCHLDMNEAVRDALELVRKVIPRRISLETALATVPLPVYVDPVELRQVLLNLALNAADAMPQTGHLTWTTALCESAPVVEHVDGTLPGPPAVTFTIADTGCGIPARHLDAIFDPFFTTKSTDKGSGLGLYNAGLFVRRSGGAVSVESVEGHGSRFTVWLPQSDFSETMAFAPVPAERRHCLLLAGGPEDMRAATAQWLRASGYHVVAITESENQTDFIRSCDYACSGVFILVEPGETHWATQIAAWRRQQPRLKFILKPLLGDREGLRGALLEQSDLVVTQDWLEVDVLERMKRLLMPEE